MSMKDAWTAETPCPGGGTQITGLYTPRSTQLLEDERSERTRGLGLRMARTTVKTCFVMRISGGHMIDINGRSCE